MNFTLSPVLSQIRLRSILYRLLLTIFLAVLLIVCAGWQHTAQAATLTVPSTQYPTIQSAIDAAQFGDTIILQAGTTFQTPNGPFILRYKTGGSGTDADYITIQSSAVANLPAGVRVSPANSASMPKLETRNYNGGFSYGPPVIVTEAYAHHYKLIGLEITADPATGLSDKDLIAFGDGSSAQNTLAQVPHHITLDRCYVHVASSQPAKRGVALNSASTSIINSYIAGFKVVGVDSQAICMWNGPGPYSIINNYIEGAAENIMMARGINSIPGLIPSDITITRNHFYKPLSWRPGDPSYAGTPWTVKNLLELKTGKTVTIDGNLFEYSWQSGQDSTAIGLAPISKGSGATPQLEDITFTNNIVRDNVKTGLNNSGDQPLNANFPAAVWTKNVQIASGPEHPYYNGTYSQPAHLGNFFPANERALGFVDYAGGNYCLAAASPYKGLATDGKDNSVDFDELNAAQNGSNLNEEAVVWTNAINVTVNGSSLTKSAATAAWDAGTSSTKAIVSGNGYVEFSAGETNTHKMCGLSNGDANQSYQDIDFALYPNAYGQIHIYESGVHRQQNGNDGVFGNYTATDRLRVAVEGGSVKYYKNGILLYTSAVAPAYPLRVDTSFWTVGGSITNAVLGGNIQPLQSTENVVWTNPVNVTANGNNLARSASTNAWDGGASSTNAIVSGDGYVQFTAGEGGYRMCGLSDGSDADQNYAEIDFALFLAAHGIINVYESAVWRAELGPYVSGDVFRISIEGGVVKYRKNGAVIYTSTVAPSYPLRVDTSLYTPNSALNNAIISGSLQTIAAGTGNVVWANVVNVTANGNNLTKSAPTNAWDAGAVSNKTLISGDGYVEFTASEKSHRMCGLSNGDANQGYGDIDFALYPAGEDQQIYIYEGGIYKAGPLGSYGPSDRLRVSVEGGIVKYRKNGQLLYTSTGGPTYPLRVDTSFWTPNATISNAVFTEIVNQPPVANAGGPYTGNTGTAIQFSGAGSSDPDGTITSYAWNFGDGANGSGISPTHAYTTAGNYTATLTVTDNSGATTSASTSVTVNAVPTSSIASPANGTVLAAPATIIISANASDSDGSISKVEFYQGSTKLGEDSTAPYTFTWSNVASGSYTLTVKATDNNGAVGTSAPVSVTVSNSTGNLVSPTSLAATNGSGNDINLLWNYSETGQAGFKIERKLGRNGTYSEIATVGASTLSYSDTGSKTANRVYAYRVRAYKTGENGPYSSFVQATTPYTGGSFKTDRAVYAEPPLPPLPHAGGKWRDEVFGTEMMRATDEDDTGSPGLSTFYSHWPTFNANNTKLLIRKGSGGAAMLKDFDAANFKLGASYALPSLPGGATIAWEGATWSNTDPNIIYCHPSYYDGGMKLYKYDVSVGTSSGFTLVRDFSSYNEGNDLLRQMYVSGDDDVFCFLHVRAEYNSNEPVYYFVYRKSTNSVLYHNPASAYVGGINEVHVDKTGHWLVIALNETQSDGKRARYLNLDTGVIDGIKDDPVEMSGGHGDIGSAMEAGFDRWSDGIKIRQYSDLHNPLTILNFATAAGQADWTQDFHGSLLSDNENWLTCGTYDDKDIRSLTDYSIFEDEILQVSLDGSHKFRRIAHTRSDVAADEPISGEITPNDSNGYWAMPKPTISKDGRYIAFTSNWENSGRTDLFILRIPRAPVLSLQDDFNDNSRDTKKWLVAMLSAAVSDPNVPVNEQNQRLEMSPLANTSGAHSNGYSIATPIDMTNKQASVEVVQATNTSSWANTVFALVADNGWYRFFTEHGQLYLEQSVNGTVSGATPLTYSSTQHRHWRIRHDPFSDTIYWETSSDGATWTVRHSAAWQLSITGMYTDLYVRTWQSESSPGTAIFDNFKFESGPWVARDLGLVGLAGSTTATTGGTYTINAAGGGIWYGNDGFHFVYRKMSGNGQIIARVASFQNAGSGAKAGVMIRERLWSSAKHASMLLTGDGNAVFRRRQSVEADSNATSTTVSSISAPHWVKLVRSGNTFTAYRSSDGVNWVSVGSDTISMESTIYVGLAVTNQSTASSCTVTLDNLSVP